MCITKGKIVQSGRNDLDRPINEAEKAHTGHKCNINKCRNHFHRQFCHPIRYTDEPIDGQRTAIRLEVLGSHHYAFESFELENDSLSLPEQQPTGEVQQISCHASLALCCIVPDQRGLKCSATGIPIQCPGTQIDWKMPFRLLLPRKPRGPTTANIASATPHDMTVQP